MAFDSAFKGLMSGVQESIVVPVIFVFLVSYRPSGTYNSS